jgi:hypothetical protein
MHRKERLVTLRLSLLDIDEIGLSDLITLREREHLENGHTIRDLRHNYLNLIEEHIKAITEGNVTESDVEELDRVFEQKCRDNMSFLVDAMGAAEKKFSLSSAVLTTVISAGKLAAATTVAPHVTLAGVVTADNALATLGGVVSARNDFIKARADVLRQHPMALIYELGETVH